MSIKPEAVTTVSRRPLVGADRPRTLAEYQAPIIARFGRLPSWPELAKHEGPFREPIDYKAADPKSPRVIALKEALAAKTATARKAILDAMTKPMTVGDVSQVVKMSSHHIRRHLVFMEAEGLVARDMIKKLSIWHRVQVAAE